jgi:DNA ligase 1
MNGDARNVHEISGLKNVIVDGFRLVNRIVTEPNVWQRYFILTHFHSDHYGGLNGSWSHGIIVCTSTTANLITSQLKVRRQFIRVLDIGDKLRIDPSSDRIISADIEFLDANHCPGAVMVVFYLHDEKQTIHLHCGDMRYHPRMKDYPFFKAKPYISKIYLDTTYADPKHDFISQDESIATVVQLSRDFVKESQTKKWLVFISAYTIGKEKLLNALLDAFDGREKVYVDPEKMSILRCLVDGDYQQRIASGQYTTNKREANIHVCSMNFAGSIWGYFKANYGNIQHYINELDQSSSPSDCETPAADSTRRVLAFIPTGMSLAEL